jgi:hypothetical protein
MASPLSPRPVPTTTIPTTIAAARRTIEGVPAHG